MFVFAIAIFSGYVPSGFKNSYTVPITKVKDTRTKALSFDNFGGTAIVQLYQ